MGDQKRVGKKTVNVFRVFNFIWVLLPVILNQSNCRMMGEQVPLKEDFQLWVCSKLIDQLLFVICSEGDNEHIKP